MPWDVRRTSACPASKPFGVVQRNNGKLMGCHATRGEANDQLAALYANEGKGMTDIIRRTFAFTDAEVKAATAEYPNGVLRGAAAVYGNVDDGGDRIRSGAMKDAIPRFLSEGFISWGHDWNDPVAYPTEAKDTKSKVDIVAPFHSTARAQEARTIAKERLDAGLSMGLSIGYGDVEAEAGAKGSQRELVKIGRWYETGLVMVPMNTSAGLTEAKGNDGGKSALADTRTSAYILFQVLELLQAEQLEGDADNDVENLSQVRDLITQYLTDQVAQVGSEADLADVLAEQAARASAGYYYMGHNTTFGDHAERVATEFRGLARRTQAVARLRSKEGRVLSQANMDRISSAVEQARSVLAELEDLLASTGDTGKSASADAIQEQLRRAQALGVL